ncbi:CopG family ribbon-helix-helix protein [Thermosediminibacter oceani]|uniref:Transcriptional regulator, CopG family n=1 Tax=Thermosediminibacter oceani (strain ATCC BAA-1034 / DSM 16646 / JW/IW-1228P) TaxID=555079 RepID=D9RZ89_THEOJ|nr:ribbon-helix-helix protein, CopG family [Thermosediminibacter oceani]ADL08643.1 transcriptional regulator, CopG family [Thermosediminibacter oceani DSM 16646]
MAELKRIVVSLPDSLLKQVDGIISKEKKNRSEFIQDAMRLYIRERERIRMREQLKNGYQEMADINLRIAEFGINEDFRDLALYEIRLSESD